MSTVWKKAMAVVAAIAIGMAAGAGCGSEERKGKRRKAEATKARGAKAEQGMANARMSWLKKPLKGIELAPAQNRKISRINAERAKSLKTRRELRAQLDEVAETEGTEGVEELRKALAAAKSTSWLPRVRAVLNEEQAKQFDANLQN